MEFICDPMKIEELSMEIIAPHLQEYQLGEAEKRICSRIIHASGDPTYARDIQIHPEAVDRGLAALRVGRPIFCDVEMVRTGINKRATARLGSEVQCLIGDQAVATAAKAQGITRSMAAMRQFGQGLNGAILAIGNAPTALFEVLRLMDEDGIRPALIIGVPVGFVGAAESKQHLVDTSPVPYITVLGNKGGSPIAAAALNALLYLLDNDRS